MMHALWEACLKFGLVAFLAVAGSATPALAQDVNASRLSGTKPGSASLPGAIAEPAIGVVATSTRENDELRRFRQAAPPQVEFIHLPTFSAAGSIEKGSLTIRLAGVAIMPVDAQCGSSPDTWPCGRMALTAIQHFVRRRTVECRMAQRPADGLAHCNVGGRDIGEWLVAQGWARANGPDYADPQKTAQNEKRGVWSSSRPGLAMEPVLEAMPALNDAAVRAEVHLSTQSMILVHRGRIVGQWPVSTARSGKETPTGVWTAKWLARHHRSRRYNDAPMPYSVFYDGDYAIHGTYQTDRLGRPASAGCVRLDPGHAAVLFNLVRKEGLNNTLIVIQF